MGKFTVTRTLPFPTEKVWSVLADFGGVHHYSAAVETSPINEGTPESGVGAERYCTFYDGNFFEERVTEAIENKLLGVEIFATSAPMKSAHATFELVPAAGGGTQLSATMDYVVRFGLIGKMMDAMMMRRMMTKSFDGLLRGLEEYMTTGKDIGKGWRPSAAA